MCREHTYKIMDNSSIMSLQSLILQCKKKKGLQCPNQFYLTLMFSNLGIGEAVNPFIRWQKKITCWGE